ncbi:hypothetical protein [Archangium lansingense]|uniref:Lipoprotein n=1 Tax=Archangium lansingense TaxID=2995310 RepID=A0ABT3ZVV6_9BACT|nr:hypothetical protein [Archangium lansinium]MCY1073204.1 hypothetical protein [Archangium lansinium]
MMRGAVRHVLPLLLLLAPAVGCHRGVRFENQVFSKPGVRYRVGALPHVWERVKLSQNDLAWYTEQTGHALSVNSTCREHEDAPLDVLTRHLVMGFTERLELEQQKVVVDEREGLRSRYRAKLDGVPVELLFLVLKKNQCIYDFTYVAPLGRYEERLEGFESLVRGFHAEDV